MSIRYSRLRDLQRSRKKTEAGMSARCAARLLKLREQFAPLRSKKNDGKLLLATWNIRDFDSNKFGFGPRLEESFFYIAEIIANFDLVALQEINADLEPLEKLMGILGREWDYIVTDVTEGSGGNQERMAYVFNIEKVWFRKMAGEIVLPDGQMIVSRKKVKTPKDTEAAALPTNTEAAVAEDTYEEVKQQFARTPFVVAFQSGWFKFNLCTVHIYYGKDSGEHLKRRIAEIEKLVEFFRKRQDTENAGIADVRMMTNYILLGDFNVVSPEHKTMQALKSEGFTVPDPIDGKKVRKLGDHFYDQIAVRAPDPRFKVTGGGILDMYKTIFRDTEEDRALYDPFVPEKDPETDPKYRADTREKLYRKWRTWQLSDHAPLWIEIETDFSEDYLASFVTDGATS